MTEILEPVEQPLKMPQQDTPFVILMVGVNGAGKTTTIGKLAKRFQRSGLLRDAGSGRHVPRCSRRATCRYGVREMTSTS